MSAIRVATLPNRRSVLLAALAGVIGLSVLFTSLTSAQSSPRPEAKPTVVLVHGAWADASSWNGVITRLQREGYPVIAPANPLRGLATDAAYIASVLDTIPGPIVLAGHSYGGAVITNAAAGHPNVKALVYIAAFIPDTGEDSVTNISRFPGSQIVPPGFPGATLIARPYPLPGGGVGIDAYIAAEPFRRIFAADVNKSTAAVMAATQRPIEAGVLQEKTAAAAWKTIPAWAIVATEDNAIGTANVRFMAQRATSHVVEVDASHVVLISRPGAVADLIRTAADSIH